MDVTTLYRDLENNVLKRDRASRRLRRTCGKSFKEEDLAKVVDQVKLLRTSRRTLSRILSELRELESYGDLEEPLETLIEYMLVVGVHVEREVLLGAAEVLGRSQSTKNYAEEIYSVDVAEIDRLLEDLRATYTAIKGRSKA